MSTVESAYLALVIGAATIFMVALAGVTWWTNQR